jgi:RNA polymerase sigma factor (TIGR02999 family)
MLEPNREGSEATRLLDRWRQGDDQAASELFRLVYAELREIADRLMRRQAGDRTLQPTALVHEAYVKLVERGVPQDWNDRLHFVRVAARAMRSVLVDHARARGALDRARGPRSDSPLEAIAGQFGANLPDLLELDEALTRLEALDPELARIVELRFFGGLSVEETATALSTSKRTVERGWTTAKLWLKAELPRPDST